MAKKTKTPALNLPVPQSDQEAEVAIARIGTLMRQIEGIEAAANDRIAAITAEAGASAAPVRAKLKAEIEGLKTYCEANRSRLTAVFTRKTAAFATGTVAWRARPAKVTLRDKVEEVIARIKTLGLKQFIRTKEEIDKEAMLKVPKLAATIAGVSIGSAGEDFAVEPLAMEIAEAVS
jgi:phage host-nuclease inhibitor protein Gam